MLSLLLLLFIYTAATAQSSKISFSEHPHTYKPADTLAIRTLLKEYDSLKTVDMQLSMSKLKDAYRKSKQIQYSWGIFFSLNRLGGETQIRGGNKEAIVYLLEALPYAENPENIQRSNIFYNNLGLSYSALGKYDKALDFYNRGLKVLSRKDVVFNNGTDSAGIYNNVGILWARMEEYSQALATFKMAESISDRLNDTLDMVMTYMNIGACYAFMRRPDESERYYEKMLKITENGQHKKYKEVVPNAATLQSYKQLPLKHKSLESYRAGALSNMMRIAMERKEYEKALEYSKEILAITVATNKPMYELLHSYRGMGITYMFMKQYDKANAILLPALEEAKKMRHIELLEDLEGAVARVYAGKEDFTKGYEHLVAYAQMQDTQVNEQKERSLSVLMDARMADKNKQGVQQQLYIAKQDTQLQRKNFLIGGTAVSALLLLSISLVSLRNFRHKQAIQQSMLSQLEQKQEINQLKAQMRGEEQERQRIAHELHDSIASQLWAIRLNVESMQEAEDDEQHRKKITSIFQQLNDATQDVRKTAHNLMPDLLLEEGLATALASLCEKMRKNTKLEVDFQEYGVLPEIDKEIELTIYRMVQELMQNVMKHAKDATSLLVQLSYAGTLLNITIEDNGTAFIEKAEGIGLQQVRKRTTSLKGHFDLQRVPGKGTTAYLEFDLQYL